VSGVQINGVGRRASDGTAKRGGCGYRDHVTNPRTRGDTWASATSATTPEETPLSRGWQECSGDGQDRPGDSRPPDNVRSVRGTRRLLIGGRLNTEIHLVWTVRPRKPITGRPVPPIPARRPARNELHETRSHRSTTTGSRTPRAYQRHGVSRFDSCSYRVRTKRARRGWPSPPSS
jgi:hypothetical protein